MSHYYKILYIIPPYFSSSDLQKPVFTIPYGILSIDAFMKKNSYNKIESSILDLNISNENSNILRNKLQKINPDIVAVSALFDTQYKYLNLLSQTVKKHSDNILVVAGGGLPTNLYEKILKECPNIDAICYGEGEIPMTDLTNSSDYEYTIEKHPSWISRKSLNKTPINSFIQNLDDIPEFDYGLIDLNNYNSRSLDKSTIQNKKREISIHTSRGCPFDCIFCANGKLHGKKVRFMSVEKVIKEVQNMIDKHGLTTLIIEDDNFLFNKERAKTILKKLSQLNIKVEFPNGLMVHNIDDEIGKLLKEAGTTTVPLAIESGSDYVLKNIIRKPLTVKMIKPVVDILRKNNLRVHAFIVIGLPGETEEHRLETLKTLQDIGFDWIHVFIAIPVSGSKLYNICVENNYLINSDMSNYNISKANIKAPNLDPEKIEDFAYYLNLYINFVNNYNVKIGQYEIAKNYFDNVVQKYPDHAFGHYFLAKAYQHLNLNELSKKHLIAFNKSIESNEMWKRYTNTLLKI